MILPINPGYRKSYELYLENGNPSISPNLSDLWKFLKWLKLEFNCKPDYTGQFLLFDTIDDCVLFQLKVL